MEGIYQSLEWWPHWIDACPDRWDKYLTVATCGCPNRGHLTKEEFLEIFPMFANTPDAWLDMLLQQTAGFNPAVWGRWLKWGEALFVAHFLAMREMLFAPWEEASTQGDTWLAGAVSSSVTSFRAGAVAYTQDTGLAEKFALEPMMQTTFGQKFLDLLRSRIAVGLVTVT